MYKARNVDGFLETTNQALFEVEDPILCAGDEGDGDTEFSAMTPDLRVLEAGLKTRRAGIKTGNYAIGRGEDPPFMSVVRKVCKCLPIIAPVDAINFATKKASRATKQRFVPAPTDV